MLDVKIWFTISELGQTLPEHIKDCKRVCIWEYTESLYYFIKSSRVGVLVYLFELIFLSSEFQTIPNSCSENSCITREEGYLFPPYIWFRIILLKLWHFNLPSIFRPIYIWNLSVDSKWFLKPYHGEVFFFCISLVLQKICLLNPPSSRSKWNNHVKTTKTLFLIQTKEERKVVKFDFLKLKTLTTHNFFAFVVVHPYHYIYIYILAYMPVP